MDEIAKIEFATVSTAQKRRHGESFDHSYNNVAASLHHVEPTMTGWTTQMWIKCQSNVSKNTSVKNTIEYTLPTTAHKLIGSFIFTVLPPIRILPTYDTLYRICWPPYVGHHIIVNGKLSDGGVVIQNISGPSIDFDYKLNVIHSESYNKRVGNVKELTEWTTSLPQYPIAKSHPWFYSRSNGSGIPINYPHERGDVKHIYTLRDKICDLLRMQRLDKKKGVWVDIKPDARVLAGSLVDMPIPELFVKVSNCTDDEHKAFLEKPYSIEYEDMTYDELPTAYAPGEKAEIKIMASTPCEMVQFGCILKHPEIQYLGNYTNNVGPDWRKVGRNPIASYQIKYGEQERGDEYPNIISDMINESCMFSTPDEAGYNCHAAAMQPGRSREYRQTGLIYSSLGAKIMIYLDPNNGELRYITDEEIKSETRGPSVDDELAEEDDEPVEKPSQSPPILYRIFSMCMLQREIIYTFDPVRKVYVVTNTLENKSTNFVSPIQNQRSPSPVPMSNPIPFSARSGNDQISQNPLSVRLGSQNIPLQQKA